MSLKFVPPNEHEKQAVERIKVKLFEEKPEASSVITETAILRFFRGRKEDEDKAYRHLIKHLEWRQENDVDNISQKTNLFETEFKAGKVVVHGRDLNDRPTVFIYAKKHNKHHRDLDEIKLLIIYCLETILKTAKPEEERMMICFDLSGFSLSCMDYDAVKILIDILQYNYPDTLHQALIINSPFVFSACWSIIKMWLDPVTAQKAVFISKSQLTDYFAHDSIPTEIQGTAINLE